MKSPRKSRATSGAHSIIKASQNVFVEKGSTDDHPRIGGGGRSFGGPCLFKHSRAGKPSIRRS